MGLEILNAGVEDLLPLFDDLDLWFSRPNKAFRA